MGLQQSRNRLSLNVIALSGQRAYKVIQVPSNNGAWRLTPRDNWRQPRQGPAFDRRHSCRQDHGNALAGSAQLAISLLLDLPAASLATASTRTYTWN